MKSVLTLSAMAAFSLLHSCKHEQPAVPANVIVPVDFSDSRDSSVARWYKETIQHSVLEKMGPKGRLIVLPIDFNSETSGQEIFKVDFSKNDYSNEYAGLQKDQIEGQNHRDSVGAAARQFEMSFDTARRRRAQLHRGTDIFGALAQARKYKMAGHRNILVIFSDMLQFSDRAKWNFEDHLNDTSEIQKYLSAAVKIDLKDMEIIVLTGDQNDMYPKKFNAVKAFWEAYFAECNGTLADYSSGAVSKLEELLK